MATPDLLRGPIGPTLVRLAIPMLLGVVSIVAFNLADTYFVGQLGAEQLAAVGFTFPVVSLIGSVAPPTRCSGSPSPVPPCPTRCSALGRRRYCRPFT